MKKCDAIKERIIQIVGDDWVDVTIVVAAVLSTPRLKLAINRDTALTVVAYLCELQVLGFIELRIIVEPGRPNQVRRMSRAAVDA